MSFGAHHEYLNKDGLIANFVLKLPNFRYRRNNGRSGANFNDAVKFSDPQKSRFVAIIWHISPVQLAL